MVAIVESTTTEQPLKGLIRRPNALKWQWFTLVAINTGEFVRPQLVILQTMYLVGTGLIYFAEKETSSVPTSTLLLWLTESLANFVLRTSLFAYFWRLSEEKKRASLWRLCPAFCAVVVGAHWWWTATLFVGDMNFTTFTTLLVFAVMSVSTMMIAPASPIAAIVYVICTWVPTAIQLLRSNWVHSDTFIILYCGVGALLFVSLWTAYGQVRRFLLKSEQIAALIDQLKSTNTTLEQTNAELEEMRSAATRELQGRTSFFNSASHDFVQRLHAMKLLTGSLPNAGDHVSTKLAESMEDLELYVRDVLEFARIESTVVSPVQERVSLQSVFQRLNVHFEAVAEAKAVDLRFRVTTAAITTDPSMLLRILENLISNALKFTRKGVLVGARRRGERWCIEVWDQGPGIDATARDLIFEAFYQDAPYADRMRVGVGLGLAIVRRLADCLKYNVEVRSRENVGSVLRVWVPADMCNSGS